MEKTLRLFTESSLYDACLQMLSRLQVAVNEVTKEAIPFVDLYQGACSATLPLALREALDKVEATYYIGNIDEATLAGRGVAKNVDEVRSDTEAGKYEGMMVFAIDVAEGRLLSRYECTTLVRGFNRIASAQPVVLFIRQGKYLSLATCERMKYSQEWRNGNGEKLGKVSILRNINCEHPHRGHLDILTSLGDKAYPTFEDLYRHWMEVFSNELLTKKFYCELSDWYAWAVQVARFPNNLKTAEDDEKFNHEACIRLITRLIFVWFLKQKRLIPGEFFDEEYIRDHFIENFNPHDRQNLYYDTGRSLYYRLILQNLFFAMLNRPIVAEGKNEANNRRFRAKVTKGMNWDYNVNNLMRYEADFMPGGAEEFLRMANCSVPFLNGGLFDCLDDKTNGLYYDGFSENPKSLAQLYLPDYLFFGDEVGESIDLSQWYGDNRKKNVSAQGIVDILSHYCFTVEENTPYDQEVSLDPELLGKAFENLLAAYNPETQTSARKQTGSFYTPREIVQYMVNESLVAHLKRVCGDADEALYRQLLSYSAEDVSVTEEQSSSIMDALYHCRVLDPACGSGAFPMGILQQMVHVLKRIDPTNEKWKDFMINRAIEQSKKAFMEDGEAERKERLADIESAFNRSVNDPDYARKLYVIEHCIYGVDIQPIATQISKLRFFISLVVDQRPTADAAHNFGIRPLPNLEAKFVSANTLIPVEYDRSLVDGIPTVVECKEKLKELNHKIFLARRNVEKQKLKEKIKETRKALAAAIQETGFVTSGVAQQLSDWDMFDQNTSSSFFDPEWMFGVKGGFDVAIGNPPYVQIPKRLYSASFFPYSEGKDVGKQNLYKLFVEYSYNALKEHGVSVLIVQSSLMCDMSSTYTREMLLKKTELINVIEFPKNSPDANEKVFKSVLQGTCISVFRKGVTDLDNTFGISINNNLSTIDEIEVERVSQNEILAAFPNRKELPLIRKGEMPIINKIKKLPKLRTLVDDSLQGNINTIHLKKIISEEDSDLFIAKGANIHRFYVDDDMFYGMDNTITKPLVANNNRAGAVIATQNITGTTDKFRIHATVVECKKTKIVFLHSVNILYLPNPRTARMILACLNSKLLDWLFRKTSTNNHCNMYELLDLPLPKDAFYDDKLDTCVLTLLESHGKNEDAMSQLDMILYHLYGLTYDEVLIVDPDTPITREEYEIPATNKVVKVAEAEPKEKQPTKRSPKTGLCVWLPNGEFIQAKQANLTMVEAVKRAGSERVANLQFPHDGAYLVSHAIHPRYKRESLPLPGGYYLNTHSSTKTKAQQLERISAALALGWSVEIIH